jgi:acyl-CoA synthetase (AMP-forming)/AMP-acid ligase II
MPKDRDIVSLLQAGAEATPNKPIYSFLDRELNCAETLTYAQLFEEARSLACFLQRCGLNRTPVLLIQQKNLEFVRSFWACLLAGAWPMPCARPRGQKWQQLAVLAVQSGAAAILTSASIARLIPRQELDGIRVIVSDVPGHELAFTDVVDPQQQWLRPSIRADDIAFIQYTSGSTSNPKGVVITHANVLSNLEKISQAFACTSNDVGLSWLPLHHDMGLIGHVLQPVHAGIHNYFLSAIDFLADPSRWLRAISKYQVTISGGPGFAYGLCARHMDQQNSALQLSQWRLAYCGSDRITADTLEQFAARYCASGFSRDAWFPCYGMAEATLFVCGVRGVSLASSVHSEDSYVCIGQLSDNQYSRDEQIYVVDPARGKACAEGVVGEIWISSASVSPGYYRQSTLSKQSFNQMVDGRSVFFRTGDLGFIVQDRLYFSGRLKNVIKVRGRNLHAEDIESLLQHETADIGLQRCVALGVRVQQLDTFVILAEHRGRRHEQHVADKKKLQQKLKNLVCDTFGVIPHAVVILPASTLPLTSSGKPVRSMCGDVYAELMRSSRADSSNPDVNTALPKTEVLANV